MNHPEGCECKNKYHFKLGELDDGSFGTLIAIKQDNGELVMLDEFGGFSTEDEARVAAEMFITGLTYTHGVKQ